MDTQLCVGLRDLVCLCTISGHTAWCGFVNLIYICGAWASRYTSAAIGRGRRPWKIHGHRGLDLGRNRPVTVMVPFRCFREPQIPMREIELGGGF